MNWHLRIGKIAGIPLLLHWSLLLIVAWLGYTSWEGALNFNTKKLLWLSIWVCLVFVSIFLHELGHAMMAKRVGIATQKIILYPLGGGAFLERNPTLPNNEIKVAFAGPLANILLTIFAAILIWGFPASGRAELLKAFVDFSAQQPFNTNNWFDFGIVIFFLLNLILAGFNLLPAFPLDGGRILRALFQKIMPHRQATQLAAAIGFIFATIFIAAAIWMNDWFFGFGAAFIALLSIVEFKKQHQIAGLEKLNAANYALKNFPRIYLYQGLTWKGFQMQMQSFDSDTPILLLNEWQQPHLVVTKKKLEEQVFLEEALFAKILPCPDWEGFYETDNLTRAFDLLNKPEYAAYPVVNKQGFAVGLITRNQLEKIIL